MEATELSYVSYISKVCVSGGDTAEITAVYRYVKHSLKINNSKIYRMKCH